MLENFNFLIILIQRINLTTIPIFLINPALYFTIFQNLCQPRYQKSVIFKTLFSLISLDIYVNICYTRLSAKNLGGFMLHHDEGLYESILYQEDPLIPYYKSLKQHKELRERK